MNSNQFRLALQQRKDHLSYLISDAVVANKEKIDLLPHMEAAIAIETLLNYFGGDDSVEATSDLDELCCRMLRLGAFSKGTSEMKASEIKERLMPFFGEDVINRSISEITQY